MNEKKIKNENERLQRIALPLTLQQLTVSDADHEVSPLSDDAVHV